MPAPRIHICYAPADRPWVRGRMLYELGLKRGQYRTRENDALGAPQLAEIRDAIETCRITALIASDAARWHTLTQFAADLVLQAVVRGQDRRLVVIRLDAGLELPLEQDYLVGLDCSTEEVTLTSLARLREELNGDVAEPPEDAIACPYPGLHSFTAANGELLFGRKQERDALLRRIRKEQTRILVLGPSGSGKSSLVHAAVLPALDAKRHVVQVVPRGALATGLRAALDSLEVPGLGLAFDAYVATGPQPTAEVRVEARAALQAAVAPDDRRRVIVIDPLEEIFVAVDGPTRARWLHGLAGLWSLPWCTVIACLRVDFLAAAMHERCWSELQDGLHMIPPLDDKGLREAIIEPARRADVYVQPELVERMIREVDADRTSAPLPLLQVVLTELWENRKRHYLSLTSYEEIVSKNARGLAAALAVHADSVMQGLNEPGDEELVQRILLDLVQLGVGRPHTRRRRTVAELGRAGDTPAQLERVLRRLIAGRLITTSGGEADSPAPDAQVDLCHDVLITGWSKLADWVASRQGDLAKHRRFEARARDWMPGRGGLFSAAEVVEVRNWQATAAGKVLGLSPDLVAMLEASEREHDRARDDYYTLIVDLAEATRSNRAADAELSRQLQHSVLEQGRRLLVAGRGTRALPFLVAAMDRGAEGVPFRQMLREAAQALPLMVHRGHQGPVHDARFVDRERIVTAGADGTAQLWDTSTGRLTIPVMHHDGELNAVAVGGAEDHQIIATAGADGAARFWNATTGELLGEVRHDGEVFVVELVTEGRWALTAGEGSARVWDVVTKEPRSPWLVHQASIWTITQVGARVVTASDDQTARVWNIATGTSLAAVRHDEAVYGARLSRSGRYLLTASADGTARIVDLTRRSATRTMRHDGRALWAAVFNGDDTKIATAGEDGVARIWDARTGTSLGSAMAHKGRLWSVAFSPDDERLATASDDSTARVWDVETGVPIAGPFEHLAAVTVATFSPDGESLLTVSDDATARLWQVGDPGESAWLGSTGDATLAMIDPRGRWALIHAEGEVLRLWLEDRVIEVTGAVRRDQAMVAIDRHEDGTLLIGYDDGRFEVVRAAGVVYEFEHGNSLAAARFAAGGTRIVSVGDGRAILWTVEPVGLRQLLTCDLDKAMRACVSPDGRCLAVASSEGLVVLSSTDAGSSIATVPHAHAIYDLAFSPDNGRLVTACGDRSARLWDLQGQQVGIAMVHRDSVTSLAFAGDGRLITTSDDSTARVWDGATGVAITQPLEHDAAVSHAAFSADGGRIVTISDDAKVRVWDAKNGGELMAPRNLRHPGLAAAFTDNGRHVVTVGSDGVVRTWNVAPAGGSHAEWQQLAERCGLYAVRDGVLIENTASWTEPTSCAALRRGCLTATEPTTGADDRLRYDALLCCARRDVPIARSVLAELARAGLRVVRPDAINDADNTFTSGLDRSLARVRHIVVLVDREFLQPRMYDEAWHTRIVLQSRHAEIMLHQLSIVAVYLEPRQGLTVPVWLRESYGVDLPGEPPWGAEEMDRLIARLRT